MSPVTLNDHVFTLQNDAWSFGVVIWEILTLGATPFADGLFAIVQSLNLFCSISPFSVAEEEVGRHISFGGRLPRPSHVSPILFRLCQDCWTSMQEAVKVRVNIAA